MSQRTAREVTRVPMQGNASRDFASRQEQDEGLTCSADWPGRAALWTLGHGTEAYGAVQNQGGHFVSGAHGDRLCPVTQDRTFCLLSSHMQARLLARRSRREARRQHQRVQRAPGLPLVQQPMLNTLKMGLLWSSLLQPLRMHSKKTWSLKVCHKH